MVYPQAPTVNPPRTLQRRCWRPSRGQDLKPARWAARAQGRAGAAGGVSGGGCGGGADGHARPPRPRENPAAPRPASTLPARPTVFMFQGPGDFDHLDGWAFWGRARGLLWRANPQAVDAAVLQSGTDGAAR